MNKVCKDDEYVVVDVETDKDTLNKILDSQYIKKIIIDINYSNQDIGSKVKRFVDKDIKASNTGRLKIEATQKNDSYIEPRKSDILLGAMESSLSNGETEANVLDENGRTETIKTVDYPLKDFINGFESRFFILVFEKLIAMFKNGKQNNK
ncbi:MAG: DUF4747 family protein [Bacteroidia bacterium]|nr:DUF4747 family protein [Bacteroidia bacterium]